LDTWFSSGIFPFSVLAWPEETSDFKRFFPNQLLETGSDILFFWVARMVMMSIQLTGKLPFTDVILHSMVRDAKGEKMSKAKGNVIDPVDVIQGISLEDLHETIRRGNLDPADLDDAIAMQKELFPKGIPECGTDSLRMGLLSYTTFGKDICLDVKKIDGFRRFCIKIWNAFKISTSFMEDFHPQDEEQLTGHESDMDKWILHRLNLAIKEVKDSFAIHDFSKATDTIHNFWWAEFCDVYLEVIKPYFYKDKDINAQTAIRNCLYICFDLGLRLLHPFMPFITEELWQRLPKRTNEAESICIASFPVFKDERCFDEINHEFQQIYSIIKEVRQMENTYNITKKQKPRLTINAKTESINLLHKYKNIMITLAYTGDIEIMCDIEPIKGCAVGIPNESSILYLHIEGLVNKEKEMKKLETKLKKTINEIESIEKRMNEPDYHMVPEEIKENNNEKLISLNQEKNNIELAISVISELS